MEIRPYVIFGVLFRKLQRALGFTVTERALRAFERSRGEHEFLVQDIERVFPVIKQMHLVDLATGVSSFQQAKANRHRLQSSVLLEQSIDNLCKALRSAPLDPEASYYLARCYQEQLRRIAASRGDTNMRIFEQEAQFVTPPSMQHFGGGGSGGTGGGSGSGSSSARSSVSSSSSSSLSSSSSSSSDSELGGELKSINSILDRVMTHCKSAQRFGWDPVLCKKCLFLSFFLAAQATQIPGFFARAGSELTDLLRIIQADSPLSSASTSTTTFSAATFSTATFSTASCAATTTAGGVGSSRSRAILNKLVDKAIQVQEELLLDTLHVALTCSELRTALVSRLESMRLYHCSHIGLAKLQRVLQPLFPFERLHSLAFDNMVSLEDDFIERQLLHSLHGVSRRPLSFLSLSGCWRLTDRTLACIHQSPACQSLTTLHLSELPLISGSKVFELVMALSSSTSSSSSSTSSSSSSSSLSTTTSTSTLLESGSSTQGNRLVNLSLAGCSSVDYQTVIMLLYHATQLVQLNLRGLSHWRPSIALNVRTPNLRVLSHDYDWTWRELEHVIERCPQLRSLLLGKVRAMNDAQLVQLGMRLPQLEVLRLDKVPFSDAVLGEFLSQCTSLQSLEFTGTNWTSNAIVAAARAGYTRSLSNLAAFFSTRDFGPLALKECLVANPELSQISLRRLTGSPKPVLREWVSVLSMMQSLTQLRIFNSNFRAAELLPVLEAHNNLRYLSLVNCKIKGPLLQHLAPFAKSLSTLKVVFCPIKSEDLFLFASALPNDHPLEKLILNTCTYLDEASIIALLERTPHLQLLDLTQTAISDAVISAICRSCRKLSTLLISQSKITMLSFKALSHSLRGLYRLHVADSICSKSVAYLGLNRNLSDMHLNCLGEPAPIESHAHLASILWREATNIECASLSERLSFLQAAMYRFSLAHQQHHAKHATLDPRAIDELTQTPTGRRQQHQPQQQQQQSSPTLERVAALLATPPTDAIDLYRFCALQSWPELAYTLMEPMYGQATKLRIINPAHHLTQLPIFLSPFRTLRSIEIRRATFLSAAELCRLATALPPHSLEVLDLSYSLLVDDSVLVSFNTQRLRSLKLRNCRMITDLGIEALVSEQLEELDVGYKFPSNDFVSRPKSNLLDEHNVTDRLVAVLTERAPRLSALSLVGRKEVRNDAIIRLIRANQGYLTSLDLRRNKWIQPAAILAALTLDDDTTSISQANLKSKSKSKSKSSSPSSSSSSSDGGESTCSTVTGGAVRVHSGGRFTHIEKLKFHKHFDAKSVQLLLGSMALRASLRVLSVRYAGSLKARDINQLTKAFTNLVHLSLGTAVAFRTGQHILKLRHYGDAMPSGKLVRTLHVHELRSKSSSGVALSLRALPLHELRIEQLGTTTLAHSDTWAQQLRRIHLGGLRISGFSTLKSCRAIEHLSITMSNAVCDAHLIDLFANLPRLRLVQLDGCTHITDHSIVGLAHHCPLVSQLSLNGCYQISNLSALVIVQHLNELQHLRLCFVSIDPVIIRYVRDHFADRLALEFIPLSQVKSELFKHYNHSLSHLDRLICAHMLVAPSDLNMSVSSFSSSTSSSNSTSAAYSFL